jgi:hypothetical protein
MRFHPLKSISTLNLNEIFKFDDDYPVLCPLRRVYIFLQAEADLKCGLSGSYKHSLDWSPLLQGLRDLKRNGKDSTVWSWPIGRRISWEGGGISHIK